jgi:methionyl-tRNA synthetase
LSNKKFITTTLPYANSAPHIGHAFEFIIGDVIARYFRNKLGDKNVIFNIGLDEHGKKIHDAAQASGLTTIQYLDQLEIKWRTFCFKFNIKFENFYRTSDYPHYSRVQQFWVRAYNKGLIYEKEYTSKYCVGCESFKLDKDLEDGKCPDHPTTEITIVSEKNFFFRLSQFKPQLEELFRLNPDILVPEQKRAEVLNIIEDLQDISISRNRENVPWGVPVPYISDQIIYVWFDALLNYIFAAGYYSNDVDFDEYWEDSVQIFGPDNLKFQAVIFQGLLASADIKNTGKLLCHGTILDKNGRKMSKSVGNVVDPMDQLQKYGVDAVKYYSLAGLNIYGNSSWDEAQLVDVYNSHLADDYGNLLSRVVTLMSRGLKDNELIGDPNIVCDHQLIIDEKICVLIRQQILELKDLWDNYRITEALIETNKIVKWCNKYINDQQPWKKEGAWWATLLELHYILCLITDLYAPVFPEKTKEAFDSLYNHNKIVLFPKIEIKEPDVQEG